MWPPEIDYIIQKERYEEFQREADHARLLKRLPRRQRRVSSLHHYSRYFYALVTAMGFGMVNK